MYCVPISLDRKRLDASFLICLFAMLIAPAFFPGLRLLFFIPFLIIAFYKRSLLTCLWYALISGFILDCLSAHAHLGLYSFDYCLTTVLLYGQRRNFFADSISTLPLMTFFFSVISTLILVILLYSIEMKNILSWKWAFTDLLVMPLYDSIYAFVCFILPSFLFGQRPRRSKDYFLTQ
jgi:rod shape-determining protein MreD